MRLMPCWLISVAEAAEYVPSVHEESRRQLQESSTPGSGIKLKTNLHCAGKDAEAATLHAHT